MQGDEIMRFSSSVKHVRAKLGISQEQLARELNISFSTVNRWENEKSHPSQMAKELFYNFCNKCKIDIGNFEKGDGMDD